MKRRAFIAHLHMCNCHLVREGNKHSIYGDKISGARTTVPRHQELRDILVKKICRDLGISPP